MIWNFLSTHSGGINEEYAGVKLHALSSLENSPSGAWPWNEVKQTSPDPQLTMLHTNNGEDAGILMIDSEEYDVVYQWYLYTRHL